jgi:hypothetical protein
MNGPALAVAAYWAPVLETIADIAFAIVIVALAVELVSGRIAKRFERQIEQANELKIAELNNETARLRAHEEVVNDALLANAKAARESALASQQNLVTAERLAFSQGLRTKEQMSEAAKVLDIASKVSFPGTQFDAVASSWNLVSFLRSLNAALITAGWIKVVRSDPVESHGEPSTADSPVLVTINFDSTNSLLLGAAEALASALNAEGISAVANQKPESDAANASVIHILIGLKDTAP